MLDSVGSTGTAVVTRQVSCGFTEKTAIDKRLQGQILVNPRQPCVYGLCRDTKVVLQNAKGIPLSTFEDPRGIDLPPHIYMKFL